jgi:predicted aspartyl protease
VTFRFNPSLATILVRGDVSGPAGTEAVALCLDTGASRTAISLDALIRAGYDPTQFPANVPMTTGSGIIHVARIPVAAFEALGQTRVNFVVIAHTLPPTAAVGGVLGLDFFEDQILALDFVRGEITLAPGSAAGPTP